MKIVHVTHHYIDGWGYQDNLLPKYQQKNGHDVVVLADNSHLPQSCREEILKKGENYFDGEVKVCKFSSYINTKNSGFFCSGLYRLLKKEKPEMIFHHGVDSSSFVVCAFYKRKHKDCFYFVDNHVDEINQSKSKAWFFINNKLLLSSVVKLLSSQIDYFWGVTPLRCEYLRNVFKAPVDKIGLLPLGGDSNVVDTIPDDVSLLRERYCIPSSSFVIVTGGKMDASKGTIDLLRVFAKLRESYKELHLILFGKADEQVRTLAEQIEGVTIKGWCGRYDTLALLKLSNVAIWPLLHTTLIDDAVSVGTPLIIKQSGNVSHYEIHQNGIYLSKGDESELELSILKILDLTFYNKVKKNATDIVNIFRYDNIVKKLDQKTLSIANNRHCEQ